MLWQQSFQKEVLPHDLGGTASTIDVAKAVASVWTGGAAAPAVDFDSVSSMRFGEAPEENKEEFSVDTFSIDEEPSL